VDVPGGDRRLTTPRRAGRLKAAWLAALALALGIAGCVTQVGQAQRENAVQLGPTLVLDVTNASSAEHTIGYEWTADDGGGSGESTTASCERVAQEFGEIRGDYSFQVDGISVLEGTVPPNAPPGGYLVIRVSIEPDGTTTAAAPLFLARAPDPQPRPLGGCG
jgi:hypothetical protein